MDTIQGTVDGIDVHALGGQPVRCFAIVNLEGQDSVQVVAYEARIQAALELSSSKGCEAEITYQDDGTHKVAVRVRLLDR